MGTYLLRQMPSIRHLRQPSWQTVCGLLTKAIGDRFIKGLSEPTPLRLFAQRSRRVFIGLYASGHKLMNTETPQIRIH